MNILKKQSTFISGTKVPSDKKCVGVFVFPYIGKKIVLCQSVQGDTYPIKANILEGENFVDSICRQSEDTLGIRLSDSSIHMVGYIISEDAPSEISIIMTGFVASIMSHKHASVVSRQLFKPEDALEKLKTAVLVEALHVVMKEFELQKYETHFSYTPELVDEDIPITQAFAFCKNEQGNFCIVRDDNEAFYSLPGGGCELDESAEACIRREIMEEAQLTCKNVHFLGSILVELKNGNVSVSRCQHLRYLVEADKIDEFVPLKNGFETVTREFVLFSQLKEMAQTLQNPNGDVLLKQVAAILGYTD